MSIWLVFVLLTFATYRLTRLVVLDDFPPILWFRGHLTGEDNIHQWTWVPEWISTLFSCQYCASAYLSLGAVLITDQFVHLPLPLLWWFGVWGSGVIVFSYETRPEVPNYDHADAVQDFLLEAIRERDLEIVTLQQQLTKPRGRAPEKIVNLPPNVQDI